MSRTSRPVRPARGWRRHLRRALGAERNALSRPVDRARSRALLLAALGFALATALGGWAAVAQFDSTHRHAVVTAAHLHRLEAVVLTPARRVDDAARTVTTDFQAQAAWTYPADRQHTGTIDVPRKAGPGTAVGIWVQDTGRLASAPPGTADLVADAVCVGLFTLGGLSVLVASGLGLRLRALDRRADRAWQRSWSALEPVWTGRTRRRPGTNDPRRG